LCCLWVCGVPGHDTFSFGSFTCVCARRFGFESPGSLESQTGLVAVKTSARRSKFSCEYQQGACLRNYALNNRRATQQNEEASEQLRDGYLVVGRFVCSMLRANTCICKGASTYVQLHAMQVQQDLHLRCVGGIVVVELVVLAWTAPSSLDR
jgi:hypothetical protein